MPRPFFVFPFCAEGCLIDDMQVARSENDAIDIASAMSANFLGVAVIEDIGPSQTRLVCKIGECRQKALDYVMRHAGGSPERHGMTW